MSIWIFLYILVAIFNIAIAYFFFKSKDGWTRKYLIAIFTTLAWSYIIRAIWGIIHYNGGEGVTSTFSLIAITPNAIVSIFFIHYLLKKHSK